VIQDQTATTDTTAADTGPGVMNAIADGDVSSAWREVAHTAGNVWNFELFKVDETQIKVSQLVIAALVLVFGTMIARTVARRVGNKVLPRFKLESGPRHAIQTISFYMMMFGVVMLSLQTAGVPLTVFTIFGGALALGFIAVILGVLKSCAASSATLDDEGVVGKEKALTKAKAKAKEEYADLLHTLTVRSDKVTRFILGREPPW